MAVVLCLDLLLLPPAVPSRRLGSCRDSGGSPAGWHVGLFCWLLPVVGGPGPRLPHLQVREKMTHEVAAGKGSDQGSEALCAPGTGSAQELYF